MIRFPKRKVSLGTKAVALGALAIGGYATYYVVSSVLLPVAILGVVGAGGYYAFKKLNS